MVTVTLGSHTFEAGPEATKRRTLLYGILEIPDGTDRIHVMGRTNKEITLGTVELSLSEYNDLYAAYLTEAEISLNIPDFEESATCRITQFSSREPAGPERILYHVDLRVVLTT
jgi:hypothetical protein